MIKKITLGIAFLLLGSRAMAQTTCTASVPAQTCKEVSTLMDPILGHGLIPGLTISMEILTAQEFKARKEKIEKEDSALGIRVMGVPQSNRPKYQQFPNGYNPDIMFLRNRYTRDSNPTKVVISAEAFEGTKDYKPDSNGVIHAVKDGRFDPQTVSEVMIFVCGYYEGLKAAFFDSEVKPLNEKW